MKRENLKEQFWNPVESCWNLVHLTDQTGMGFEAKILIDQKEFQT